MRTYHCVTTTVNDRGVVRANITGTIKAASKPEDGFTSTSRQDIYTDWFDSLEQAQKFVEDAKLA